MIRNIVLVGVILSVVAICNSFQLISPLKNYNVLLEETVSIGTQVWMKNNLNVAEFKNGDAIPEAKTKEDWSLALDNKKPAWCYYNNDVNNGYKYGKIYNWYAVTDPRGLAPSGWHIPTESEWDILLDFLGGAEIAGSQLKNKFGWLENGNGTNTSNFSALPGGHRGIVNHPFGQLGTLGIWWSSTDCVVVRAWTYAIISQNQSVTKQDISKRFGCSVRCIKDN